MAYIELTNEGIYWVDENEAKCNAESMKEQKLLQQEIKKIQNSAFKDKLEAKVSAELND